jgi:hypothetical protein
MLISLLLVAFVGLIINYFRVGLLPKTLVLSFLAVIFTLDTSAAIVLIAVASPNVVVVPS